jgi:hypothetical protein
MDYGDSRHHAGERVPPVIRRGGCGWLDLHR